MRIVVTGLVATYPMGGMSWAYLSYVDGLRRLGHHVIYLEDTGGWFYDPSRQTFTAEIRANLRYLERALRFIGAGDVAWAVRGPDGCLHGMESGRLAKACHGADLFLNLSGSCWLRDEYRRARRTAYVDTDPGYTQAKLWAVGEGGQTREIASPRRWCGRTIASLPLPSTSALQIVKSHAAVFGGCRRDSRWFSLTGRSVSIPGRRDSPP